jgi:hypothetical protein
MRMVPRSGCQRRGMIGRCLTYPWTYVDKEACQEACPIWAQAKEGERGSEASFSAEHAVQRLNFVNATF